MAACEGQMHRSSFITIIALVFQTFKQCGSTRRSSYECECHLLDKELQSLALIPNNYRKKVTTEIEA